MALTTLQAQVYAGFWGVATAAATAVAARHRLRLGEELPAYGRFLRIPWKFATFLLSGGFFVLVAPYTPDPTWDRIDAAFMSIAAFLTAPWAVGTLARVARKQAPASLALLAAVVWMWSASWSYDAYIWWRDGVYPSTWWSNIIASSVLYACAGLFWSLEYREGVTFTFLHDGWAPRRGGGWRLVILAAILGGLVLAMMLPFVEDLLPGKSPR
jgi:hypothetical protein